MVREKQEASYNVGQTKIRFPQVFYQAQILTTGIIDDIEEVQKIIDSS